MFYVFIFTFCIFTKTSAEFVKLKYSYSPSNEIKLQILDQESILRVSTSTASPSLNAAAPTNRPTSKSEPVIAVTNQSNGLSNFHSAITSFVFLNKTDAVVHPEVLIQTDGKVKEESLARQAVISHISTLTFRSPGAVIMPTLATNLLNCTASSSNGIWSEWVIFEACTADCGSCGKQTRVRQCMSYNVMTGNGCPCEGVYKQLLPCNINVCNYPWPSCCPPYSLMYVNNTFACGPQSSDIIYTFLSQHNIINRTTGVER